MKEKLLSLLDRAPINTYAIRAYETPIIVTVTSLLAGIVTAAFAWIAFIQGDLPRYSAIAFILLSQTVAIGTLVARMRGRYDNLIGFISMRTSLHLACSLVVIAIFGTQTIVSAVLILALTIPFCLDLYQVGRHDEIARAL